MIPTTERGRRAGFSLIEYLIAVVLLSLFIGTMVASSSSMLSTSSSVDIRTKLQEQGESAIASIVEDLRKSGFVGGYPVLFEDGDAQPPVDAFAHAPVPEGADANDPDFGVNREIVFLSFADDDGDGVPDFDADGDLVWSAVRTAYVLVQGPTGSNQLQRRTEDGNIRVIADHVERVTFDDIVTSGFQVPLGTVRVRIWFRAPDGRGHEVIHDVEAGVRLRNG